MSVNLYKSIEVLDKETNKWKLVNVNNHYEFKCSLDLRDILKNKGLNEINLLDVSDKLRGLLCGKQHDEFSSYKKYYILTGEELEIIADSIIKKPLEVHYNDSVNEKLDRIMNHLGINNDNNETDYDELKEILYVISSIMHEIGEIMALVHVTIGHKVYDLNNVRLILHYE